MKGLPLYYDYISTISITENPVLNSRTKHIEGKYHFIKDHVQEKDIEIQYISTDQQVGDFFTKPLGEEKYTNLDMTWAMCLTFLTSEC